MKWRFKRIDADGNEPEFVPLSREELHEIKSDFVPMVPTTDRRNEVFGMEPFLTPFAEEIRVRQVAMERVPYIAEYTINELLVTKRDYPDEVARHQRCRLEAMVCTDTTHVDVTFEWDIWARWKRWLRLTRWLPVRKRTVRIDGRVLYPYLKVSLPQNRQHVQFAVRP